MLTKQEAVSLSLRPLHLRTTAVVGPLLMLSSAFLFAVVDALIEFLGPSYRAWDIAFLRFSCGMAILLLVFGRSHSHFFHGQNRKLLVLRGIAGSLAFLAQIVAIHMIPLSTALVIFYAFPAFAALFSALFFKEKITREFVWVVTALCGVAVFFDFRLEGGILGQFISAAGAAFAGIAVTAVKKLRETNGAVTIYFYFCLTGAALTFIPFASHPQLPDSSQDWLVMGSIVCIALVAQLLMNQGFSYCKSWEGGLFLTSEVIFVAIWGIFFLQETVSWHFWTGGTMILGSIVALNMANGRRSPLCSTEPPPPCHSK